MFLGVHTPLDLIVATAIVLAVCYINYRVLEWSHRSERNRMFALLGYAVAAIAMGIASDLLAGKFLANKMTCLAIAIPLCLLIEERFIRYEVPESRPLKDRILLSIPGLIVGCALMKGISLMHLSLGVNIYCLVMAVFVILVYPYIMKRYLARDDDKSAEEGIRTPGEMLHRFSRPAPWARLSYLRLTQPMVGAYFIIVQERGPHEATCGLSCR